MNFGYIAGELSFAANSRPSELAQTPREFASGSPTPAVIYNNLSAKSAKSDLKPG